MGVLYIFQACWCEPDRLSIFCLIKWCCEELGYSWSNSVLYFSVIGK